MAYQAKRRKQFKEDFELLDETGEVVESLHVLLDADDMVAKISRKYTALTKTLYETTEMKRKIEEGSELDKCIDTLGLAVMDLLEAVFGSEDAKVILNFYENRYMEMCKEVLPFITQVVIPQLVEMKNENKKSLLTKYNRKPNRKLRMK